MTYIHAPYITYITYIACNMGLLMTLKTARTRKLCVLSLHPSQQHESGGGGEDREGKSGTEREREGKRRRERDRKERGERSGKEGGGKARGQERAREGNTALRRVCNALNMRKMTNKPHKKQKFKVC